MGFHVEIEQILGDRFLLNILRILLSLSPPLPRLSLSLSLSSTLPRLRLSSPQVMSISINLSQVTLMLISRQLTVKRLLSLNQDTVTIQAITSLKQVTDILSNQLISLKQVTDILSNRLINLIQGTGMFSSRQLTVMLNQPLLRFRLRFLLNQILLMLTGGLRNIQPLASLSSISSLNRLRLSQVHPLRQVQPFHKMQVHSSIHPTRISILHILEVKYLNHRLLIRPSIQDLDNAVAVNSNKSMLRSALTRLRDRRMC